MASITEGEDRLSSLPDSILIHILSFLPTLDAVRTMLIKTFGTLWTSLSSLDLDDSMLDIWHNDYYDGDDNDEMTSLNLAFFNFALNVLMRHKHSKIVNFRVNISHMFCSDIHTRNLGHELDSWINFALRKNVEVLEFNVGMVEPGEEEYKFPYSKFVNDSLIELKLEFVVMKLQSRVMMSSLRVLRLIRVSLMSDDVFREVIRGCPLLNELEMYNCWDLNELSFCAPNVEKLNLDTTEGYYISESALRINCPNLRSFKFNGFVDSVTVLSLSSLFDVTFNLNCRNVEFKEFPEFAAVLKTLLCAKVVKLSSEFITVLFYCLLKDHPHITVNWKRLELSMWLTERHIPGLSCLLRNSPHLEDLVINVTNWHPDFLETIESELDNQMLEGEECWSSLKRITIHNNGCSSYVVLVRLIEIVLKNAIGLDELVIYYKDKAKSYWNCELTPEQLGEMLILQKLSTFSKAFQHVKVLLL